MRRGAAASEYTASHPGEMADGKWLEITELRHQATFSTIYHLPFTIATASVSEREREA